jgi:glucose-6-phosphate dehydrogenase assembly protein OpcA
VNENVTDDVWSAQDTSPDAIEAALRELLRQRHAEDATFVPARVLNLVVIVDRDWRGEIENRLEQVGRYHPSRTIVCAVDPRRTTLDAWVTMSAEGGKSPGELCVGHERVELELGPKHLARLDTIIDPLVVTDLATLLWSPHGHPEAVDSLIALAQVVLLDSVDEPELRLALERVTELANKAYVVDLAWLRSTPWRERVAATFDPKPWREELRRISAVKARHHPESGVAGVLFFGWLASRLGWQPGSLLDTGGVLHGKASSRRQEVALRLEPDPRQSVRGLAGVSIETASGMSISLDRAPGGLRATRRTHDGRESQWTLLGASRGEGGILGEGVRQALLRDPTYRPALDAARAMVG